MSSASNTATRTVGNKKTTASYRVDSSGFGYSTLTADFKAEFNFLINDMPNKLDEAMREIEAASNITDAFVFSGGASATNISAARDELSTDINALKSALTELHSAFMTDIDNVNAELTYNFGWIIIGNCKGTEKTSTIETQSTN